jgi:hypothetical protein
MHDPANQFSCTFDSMYAYPPQIKPVFDKVAYDISQHIRNTNALVDTPFPRGIFVTIMAAAHEESKLKRCKLNDEYKSVHVWLVVSGDAGWDAADRDEMEPEVRRIIDKVLTLVYAKYKLDSSLIKSW